MVGNLLPLAVGSTKRGKSGLNDSNSGEDPLIVEPLVPIVVPIGKTDGNSGSPAGVEGRVKNLYFCGKWLFENTGVTCVSGKVREQLYSK